MTPAEIYSYRFCLGREAPAGDLRDALARQFDDPVPLDIWGGGEWRRVTDWRTLTAAGEAIGKRDWKTSDRLAALNTLYPEYDWTSLLAGSPDGELSSAVARQARQWISPGAPDYWGPLFRYAQTGDRPALARVLLDEQNRCPTSESIVDQTYCFWVHSLNWHALSTYEEYLHSAITDEFMYVHYLNAQDNRANSKNPPDENLWRELNEILGGGPGIPGSDLTEGALLLTGLNNGTFMPEWQAQGTRTINWWKGDQVIRTETFGPSDGTDRIIKDYLEWMAMQPEVARYQVFRLVCPILGRNLTEKLHQHLVDVWMNNGGSKRHVLQAMAHHDDAWNPLRGHANNTLVGIVTHMNENGLAWPAPGKQPVNWKKQIGYFPDLAPNPEGYPIDESVMKGSFLSNRNEWPGTVEMRIRSTAADRIFV